MTPPATAPPARPVAAPPIMAPAAPPSSAPPSVLSCAATGCIAVSAMSVNATKVVANRVIGPPSCPPSYAKFQRLSNRALGADCGQLEVLIVPQQQRSRGRLPAAMDRLPRRVDGNEFPPEFLDAGGRVVVGVG